MLKAVGMGELVTDSTEEYEEVAVALALDMDKLWDLRKKVEEKRLSCPLFDTQRTVKDLEAEQMEAFEHSQDLHEADGMIASKEAAEVELEMRGLQQSQAEAVFEDELQVSLLARD